MATSRRRRRRSGISQADSAEQVARLSQRSIVNAKQAGREEPVRVAVPVGTLDDGTLAMVDPAGMVQLTGCDWVLDWWIGAEDGWHFPSSDPTVAQNLLGFSPVVRTTLHVPGGNIIQRVQGVRSSATASSGHNDGAAWSGAGVVIEVENQSAVPVALAFVLRPLTLWSEGSISELHSSGSAVSVDGRIAAIVSRPIARRVVGPPGTTAIRLDLEDDEQPDGAWSVEGQLAEGAFIVPLPHTAVARVLLPVDGGPFFDLPDDDQTTMPMISWDAPSSEQVEAGWKALTRSRVSISSPEPLLDGLVDASQRFLQIVSHDDFYRGVAGCSAALRNALLSEALVTCGADEALEPLAKALADADRVRGGIRMDDRSDASVALLHSAGPLLCGSRSEHWQDILLGPVAKAIHRLSKGKALGERESGGDPVALEALVSSAALASARLSPALLHIDQPEVAAAAHDLYHQLVSTSAELASSAKAATPDGSLSADESSSTLNRLLNVRHMLAQGSPDAVSAMMDLARLGHLSVLPALIGPNGVPDSENPFDSASTAVRLSTVLDVFVRESPASIQILPTWSELWFGKPIEVNNVRTRLGSVSFALRWSESRPIVLWEIEPGVGVDRELLTPIVTSPGLDATWHGHGWTGEAIMGAVEVSQETLDEIANRDRPKMAVTLGTKKPGAKG